jgi:hypothetical protein
MNSVRLVAVTRFDLPSNGGSFRSNSHSIADLMPQTKGLESAWWRAKWCDARSHFLAERASTPNN